MKSLDYTKIWSFEDTLNYLIHRLTSLCPELNNFDPKSVTMTLLDLFAGLHMVRTVYLERTANETYFPTCKSLKSALKHAKLVGYSPQTATTATTQVRFETSGPATIPAGTVVKTSTTGTEEKEVKFETIETKQISEEGYVDVWVRHGTKVSDEMLGIGDNSTWQSFILQKPSVIDGTLRIFVDGEEWTKVDTFIGASSTDKIYITELMSDNRLKIIFGNRILGMAPPEGATISASYSYGGGYEGNVGAYKINVLESNIENVTKVYNIYPATGGAPVEGVESIKRNAPASLKILNRAVSRDDYIILAERWTSSSGIGVAQAGVFTVGNLVYVMVVPEGGGYPPEDMLEELQEYLEARNPMSDLVAVIPPSYKSIDVVVDLWVSSWADAQETSSAVEEKIYAILDPTYQTDDGIYPNRFGTDLYLSKLYEAIESVEGVAHALVKQPTGDVSIRDDQIVSPGSITITIKSSPSSVDVKTLTRLREEQKDKFVEISDN